MQPSHPTRPGAVIRYVGSSLDTCPMTTFAGKTAASADKVRGATTRRRRWPDSLPTGFTRRGRRSSNHPAAMAESCANSPPSQTTRTVWNSLRARRKSRGTSRPSTLRTFYLAAQDPTRQLGWRCRQPALHPLRKLGIRTTGSGTRIDAACGPTTDQTDQCLGPVCRGEHDASA